MSDNQTGKLIRYLTAASEILRDPELTLDVRKQGAEHTYDCRGCGRSWSNHSRVAVEDSALDHAKQCRALPGDR